MPHTSRQGVKKVSFTACHSGKLQLACTSPQVISTSPQTLYADFTKYESFQPISNLKFVSKLVEKAACVQLTDYITSNGLSETFQSACK